MALSKSQQQCALLYLLGIAPPAEPEPKLWDGISERVYIDGDIDLLEVYSEWHMAMEDWSRCRLRLE
jgi:hypothetical protein